VVKLAFVQLSDWSSLDLAAKAHFAGTSGSLRCAARASALLLLSIIFCIPIRARAQSDETGIAPETVRKGYLYKEEWSIDAALHTNGFYFGFNRGSIHTYRKTRTTHIGIGMLGHPLETRISQPTGFSYRNYSSYKFGKVNHLINLRAGRGTILTLTEKARKKGIALGLRYEGGVTLGLLKPYYLQVREERDGVIVARQIRYVDAPEDFLNPDHILGRGSFFKGMNKVKLAPGLFGRLAFRFDPGAYDNFIRTLETGVQLDLYASKPEIMVSEKNAQYYLNFYLNVQLGSRKTRSGKAN